VIFKVIFYITKEFLSWVVIGTIGWKKQEEYQQLQVSPLLPEHDECYSYP